MKKYFAHSTDSIDKSDWQSLEDHLNSVSKKAGCFANSFNARSWASLLGEKHDLGKGTYRWQAYLRHANNIVDEFSEFYNGHPTHAFAGAQWLYENSKEAGKLLSYCVAGHHGGLPNWTEGNAEGSGLKRRLEQSYSEIEIPHSISGFPDQLPFSLDPPDQGRTGYQLQFFTRMLFSCLVDADFLDTEASLNKEKSRWRSQYPEIKTLYNRFWSNFNVLREEADNDLEVTEVNRQRERVLKDCLQMAKLEPGLFSLTVPTGGGKTLASLAFALNHARKNKNLRRIIYVIPFTSIIEQNAGVFRNMLGDDAVLEHHCNFISDDSDWKSRLASENWDAPIVVTTNVQFFDSFYANKPSRCRKLHNVANSIVIFDEVQAIPVEKLYPCIEVIKELSLNYGVTSVLCTATQPAIEVSDLFEPGLKNVTKIIKNIPQLFSELKRTEEIYIGEYSEHDIAQLLLEQEQVLCIVNSRQQALDIFNALPESDENIHLSALMHPVHRTKKLDKIRKRLDLKKPKPCRVVSTQLIEAGVDVDFPSVFRMVAGIDSIAQAAGRCNRNGRNKTPCKVSVFDLPGGAGCSFFRQASQSALKLFKTYAGNLTSPECVHEYFTDYYWKNVQMMDADGIIDECRLAQSLDIQFKRIAEFHMIQSVTLPVIIALDDDVAGLVDSLEFVKYKRGVLRKLQQFSVQIYPYQLVEIQDWLENPLPDVWVLRSKELYSDITGLKCESPEGTAFFDN